jgi:hypothetical protein
LCNGYKILVGKPEGNRPFWILRRRWEETIKMDLKEIGYDVWIHLAQGRVQIWVFPCLEVFGHHYTDRLLVIL